MTPLYRLINGMAPIRPSPRTYPFWWCNPQFSWLFSWLYSYTVCPWVHIHMATAGAFEWPWNGMGTKPVMNSLWETPCVSCWNSFHLEIVKRPRNLQKNIMSPWLSIPGPRLSIRVFPCHDSPPFFSASYAQRNSWLCTTMKTIQTNIKPSKFVAVATWRSSMLLSRRTYAHDWWQKINVLREYG